MKFTTTEILLLRDPAIFQAKNRLSQKLIRVCSSLKDAIQEEIAGWKFIAPPDFNAMRFKLSRGENLEGFPYSYLDCPQYFTTSDKLCVRTVFWWGNYIISSLILEGKELPSYRSNLLKIRANLDRFYLTCGGTIWEWNRRRNREIRINGNKKAVETVITGSSFIKISWYLNFKQFFDPRFRFITHQLKQLEKLRPVFTHS